MTKGGSSDIEGFSVLAMRSFAANVEIPGLEESNQLDEREFTFDDNDTNIASPSTYSDSSEESGDLILKETYDLPLGERIINKLLKFIGLPAAFAEEKEITVKLTAKDDDELFIDDEFDVEEEEDEFDEFSNDDDATPSQARKSFMSLSLASSLKSRSSMSDSLATASEASILRKKEYG
uniref:hypothetical protein n=1 Tax=Clostridium sp. NkU-1 TaxID=1095009 RepID=UPI0006D17A1E